MRRVVAITEDWIVDPLNLFVRIDAGLAQRVRDEHFDQAFLLAHADPTAAQFAHIGEMLGAIPFEKGRIAPTAGDIDIGAQRALVDRRFDVDSGGDVHPMILNRHGQTFALDGTRNQAARVVFKFFESFVGEKTLLFGDEDRDLVTDVVVAIGDENRLVECAHHGSFALCYFNATRLPPGPYGAENWGTSSPYHSGNRRVKDRERSY